MLGKYYDTDCIINKINVLLSMRLWSASAIESRSWLTKQYWT